VDSLAWLPRERRTGPDGSEAGPDGSRAGPDGSRAGSPREGSAS
jgi:hypothetical protein